MSAVASLYESQLQNTAGASGCKREEDTGAFEAIKYLTEALQSISELELEDKLEKIIDAVEKQPFKLKGRVSSNMIERSVVEAAVQECSQSIDETMYVGPHGPNPWHEWPQGLCSYPEAAKGFDPKSGSCHRPFAFLSIPQCTSLTEQKQQPGLILSTLLPQTVSHEVKEVGVIEEVMYVCFLTGPPLVLLLMTQDSLQVIEVSIL
ncbi:hypothetical protein P7K49_018025 [Saguinus oedipus]|uniref:DNA polymerase epsilon subunit B N-terminal domain-containing protein n=1 Tax=Saguinus oedipus TaxID=9490 RepID=A0ABQ9V5B1_SAGOE|nr:hypothetical protein P7K49_018025 [Saguinus oedipus]